jgi:hypothetical protein
MTAEEDEAIAALAGATDTPGSPVPADPPPPAPIVMNPGRADWLYDAEFGGHIPCCSQPKGAWRCCNGPLDEDAVLSGDCGEQHDEVENARGEEGNAAGAKFLDVPLRRSDDSLADESRTVRPEAPTAVCEYTQGESGSPVPAVPEKDAPE